MTKFVEHVHFADLICIAIIMGFGWLVKKIKARRGNCEHCDHTKGEPKV